MFLVLLKAPPAPCRRPGRAGGSSPWPSATAATDRADQVAAHPGADPVFDLLGELPYTQVQSYLDDGEPKGDHYYWKTEYLAELDDGLLSAAREVFAKCPMPDGEVGFLQLDGALNERDADDGAVGNRDTRFAVGVKGRWQADGADTHGFLRWVRDGGELRPFSTGRTYINFQTADEGEDRVRATYADNFDLAGPGQAALTPTTCSAPTATSALRRAKRCHRHEPQMTERSGKDNMQRTSNLDRGAGLAGLALARALRQAGLASR